jgi:hypothetical protein
MGMGFDDIDIDGVLAAALSLADRDILTTNRDILKDIRAVKTIEKKRLPAGTRVFDTLDAAEFFASVLTEGRAWAGPRHFVGRTYIVTGVTDRQRFLDDRIAGFVVEVEDEDGEFAGQLTRFRYTAPDGSTLLLLTSRAGGSSEKKC